MKDEGIDKNISNALREIFNKENLIKNKSLYFLITTFFILIFLQIIVGGFETALLIYIIIITVYAYFKIMK